MNIGRDTSRPRVSIVQRVLPHYRVPFFERLYEDLAARHVELRLVYGDERPGTVPRTVRIEAPWSHWIENRYIAIGNRELVWQPALGALRGSSMVVVEQANRLLLNHLLMSGAVLHGVPLAYWGHGQNFQGRGVLNRMSGGLARALLRRIDWFFAYTTLSLRPLEVAGFSPERTTVLRNSIDTRELASAVRAITPEARERLRAELGIASEKIGLYCGGLYPNKRIGFLLDACRRIRAEVPDFHLIVVGDGPDLPLVREAAASSAWIHPVGARFGAERAPYFALGKALLMPGLVGLAIVDAFAACCPLITMNSPLHGPEISYLENGINGLMTEDSLEAYAGTVIRFLGDATMQKRLAEGCEAAARDTTIETMSRNFTEGVVRCLGAGPRRAEPSRSPSSPRLPRLGE